MAQTQVIVDYYAVLSISQTADATSIKAAYKTAAKAKHPDKNPSPDATSEFQCLGEAYGTLIDETRRAHYDAAIYPNIRKNRHASPAANHASSSTEPVFSEEEKAAQRRAQEAVFSRIEIEALALHECFLMHEKREKQRQTDTINRLQRERTYLAALEAEIERLAAQRAACLARSHIAPSCTDPANGDAHANANRIWSKSSGGNDEMRFHVQAKRDEIALLERSMANRTRSRERRFSTFQVRLEKLNRQWVANGGFPGFKRSEDE
ncbi:hypothetical protein BDW74DRAFT_171987 [Aspergillus multicolor]|uniref:uncharacterized protein n=1 Tax=Aspergillus multicolor TaxID=41759 RepID=UPI003CCCFEF0